MKNILFSKASVFNQVIFSVLFVPALLAGFFVFSHQADAAVDISTVLEATSTPLLNCNSYNCNLSFPLHINPGTEYVVGHLQVQGFGTYAPRLSDGSALHSELLGSRVWAFYFQPQDIPPGGKDLNLIFDYKEGFLITYTIQIFGLDDKEGELVLQNTSSYAANQENTTIDPSGADEDLFFWDVFNNLNQTANTVESMTNESGATSIGSSLVSSWEGWGYKRAYSLQRAFYSNQKLSQLFTIVPPTSVQDGYIYRFSFNSSSTTPEPKRNPVIIVPGIIASYLNGATTGEEFWLNLGNEHLGCINSCQSIFCKMNCIKNCFSDDNLICSIDDSFLWQLALLNNGTERPENNFYPSDILRSIDDLDFFSGLIGELENDKYKEGVDLFVFPYDWRMNLNDIVSVGDDCFSTTTLKCKIEEVKRETGSEKVDVIAHSMGGLVVKDYINIYGDENINKFIDIATPHLGSPKAFKILNYGDNLGISKTYLGLSWGLSAGMVKNISQNFPSIYQILPSRKYFESGIPGILPTNGYIYDIVAGDQNFGILSGLTYDQSIEYLAYAKDEKGETRNQYLLGELDVNAVNVNDELHSRLDDMPISDSYYNIIGCGQATYAGIQKKGDESWALPPIDGDGTVPLKSALPFGSKKYYSTSTVHSQIPSVDGVRQLVVSILQGKENDFDTSVYPGLSKSVSICGINGTQIGSLSPVELHIYDENGNHVGPTVDGDIEIGISGATYDVLGEEKFAFLPAGHVYHIENRAISFGQMGIIIKRIENNEAVESVYFDSIDLASASTTVEYVVSDDQSSYSAQVDLDGDGVVDDSFLPDSVLVGQEEINDVITPQTDIDISGQLGENGYYVSDVALTLSAIDNTDGSGVLKTLYSVDGGLNWQEYDNHISISSEGENKILYYSKDKAANSEEVKGIVVKIDKAAPQITPITPQPNQETLRNERLNVEYLVDDNYSGVAEGQDELYLDGQRISSREIDLFRNNLVQHSLKISVKDLAGNLAEEIVPFYAVTSISGTIADIGRAYDEDLMNEKAKKTLIDDLHNIQDYLNKNAKREERRDSVEREIMARCVQKKGQAWCEDKLADVFEKIDYKLNEVQKRVVRVKYELILKKLDLYEKIGWITKVGSGIIKEDVKYLINNIK